MKGTKGWFAALVGLTGLGMLLTTSDAKARGGSSEAMARANETMREVQRIALETDEPIPEGKLAAYATATAALKSSDPDAYRYHVHLRTSFEVENAWRTEESKAGPNLARLLGGEVVSAGASAGKSLSVSVAAKKGTCYTAFARYRTLGGRDQVNDFDWSAKAGSSQLQRYGQRQVGLRQLSPVGFCATADVQATLSATLEFAGTKNALRYVVLAHEKPKFPLWLATYATARWGDSCDADAWFKLWTDPVPGSIAYAKNEPYLLTSPDGPGQTWTMAASATLKSRVTLRKVDLTSKAPARVTFAHYEFPGCASERPEHPDSVALAKCNSAIDAKYKGAYDAAVAARDNAPNDAIYRAAEERVRRVQAQDEADRVRLCDPIRERASKRWQAAYDAFVDAYTEHPPASTLDRAGELAAHERAIGGR